MPKLRVEAIVHPAYSNEKCKSRKRIVREIVTIKEGGLWESDHWEIHFSDILEEEEEGKAPCPHCEDRHIHDYKYSRNYQVQKTVWICPRVVVAYNESGYNSTGICLDCILEAAKTLK